MVSMTDSLPMPNGLVIQQSAETVSFTVKVVPASSRCALSGIYDGMLKVKLSAAPEKGKANEELIGFLAKMMNIKKKNISIISGKTNPVKQIEIKPITVNKLMDSLK